MCAMSLTSAALSRIFPHSIVVPSTLRELQIAREEGKGREDELHAERDGEMEAGRLEEDEEIGC